MTRTEPEHAAAELNAADSMAACAIENPLVNKLRAAGKNALKYASLAGATLVLASCRSNSTQNQIRARLEADLAPQVATQAMEQIQKDADKRQGAGRPELYLKDCLKSLSRNPEQFYRERGLQTLAISESARARMDEMFSDAPTLRGATPADLAKMSISTARTKLKRIRISGDNNWGFVANLDSGTHAMLTYDKNKDPKAYKKRPTSIAIYSPQYRRFGETTDVGVDAKGVPNYSIVFEPWIHSAVTLESKTQHALQCAPR